MHALDKTLRRQLENTVIKARDVAEQAAEAVLKQLTVGDNKPGSHLTDDQRKLRNRLRAHGRLVGDYRDGGGQQTTYKLITEVAYEHWHRMLFARFLAENHLLMYSDGDTVLSLDDCNELAKDNDENMGATNGWELAGLYAAKMLPQIFRPQSPVFALKFAPEHQRALEKLLASLDQSVFQASDSLGWVYQFWQSKKKDQVNASEVKIGADELPAVTQLFTEPYMVHFLLDNSLGAWWVSNYPQHRSVVALEYLRTLEDGKPAAGEFESWPKQLAELKVLDPSCGSGHFLVAAFLMLVPMRMAAENLSAQEAIDKVLTENIHGLELDQRCVELAAFALALTAWRYPDEFGNAIGYRQLPELQLDCSGQGINTSLEDWKVLAEGDTKLEHGLEQLYQLFKDAPTLGSLINPHRVLGSDLVSADWSEIQPLLTKALGGQQSEELRELGIVAQGIAKAAELLASKYHWVVTNVPYLSGRKQNNLLKEFCAANYDSGKNDLAAVFVLRCQEYLDKSGSASLVTPQYWLFKSSYGYLRGDILKKRQFNLVVRLGVGAFETISGEVVNVALTTFSNSAPQKSTKFSFFDASESKNTLDKAKIIQKGKVQRILQQTQYNNPGHKITGSIVQPETLLKNYVAAPQGIKTGDDEKWRRRFWEVEKLSNRWETYQSTVSDNELYGGRSLILDWLTAGIGMTRPRLDTVAINKKGVAISQSGDLAATLYTGQRFDSNVAPLVINEPELILPLWVYCLSGQYTRDVREIDQSLKVTNVPLTQVTFDVEHWKKVAAEKYPNGLPKPYSDDPTQWIFHGHPANAEEPLQVAVARLLGYRWPAELDDEMELSDEARALITRSETLDRYSDDDGIVCIPAVRGEKSAADRLNDLLLAAGTPTVAKLLEQVQCKGKNLEFWLREKFFEQHCKLFHHRPFIWQIWDGQKDGFSALVNYHKLTRKNLETLVFTYLGDWLRTQEQQVNDGIDGADIRLQAARNLEKKLKAIIEGEAPLDIFVRWKSESEQPIGWNPDLNDGVRLNIRPFLLCGDVGKKGAGILRTKPNIHWKKDRGKDVPSAPWFEKFGGDRINDYHLTLAEKKAAQQ